jgi:hypothetical protein
MSKFRIQQSTIEGAFHLNARCESLIVNELCQVGLAAQMAFTPGVQSFRVYPSNDKLQVESALS